jgi:hypothetical protein
MRALLWTTGLLKFLILAMALLNILALLGSSLKV